MEVEIQHASERVALKALAGNASSIGQIRDIQPLIDSQLTLGPFSLDTDARRLIKNGKVIELFPQELALLEFFLRYPNKVFTMEAIQQRVWPSDSESSPMTIRA